MIVRGGSPLWRHDDCSWCSSSGLLLGACCWWRWVSFRIAIALSIMTSLATWHVNHVVVDALAFHSWHLNHMVFCIILLAGRRRTYAWFLAQLRRCTWRLSE